MYVSPEERGMKFKELRIKTADNLKLQGWFIHQHSEPEKQTTVVFFHENAGNIGLRMDWFEQMYKRLKVNILCVAYRGYSRSEGEPNEDDIMKDVDEIINYCKTEEMIHNDKVFVFGRSLGGAVAIHTLRKLEEKGEHFFKGAVIENTFTNISSMAEAVFPLFRYIPGLKNKLLRLKWESNKQVPHLKTPLFYISGEVDTFVPTEQTWELYNTSHKTDWKDIWIVPGGNHNNTFIMAGPAYFDKCQAFMTKCITRNFDSDKKLKSNSIFDDGLQLKKEQ